MYISASILVNQVFSSTRILSDKVALKAENNCAERLFRITGKYPSRNKPKHQDYRKVEKFLRNLTPAEKRVMSILIIMSRIFGKITASAVTIARLAKCCTKTVYRSFRKISKFGIIKRKRRGREGRYDNSSITSVSPIVEHPYLRSRLWPIFDAYTYFKRNAPRYLLLYLLFSVNVPLENSSLIISQVDTHLYKNIYLKKEHTSKINQEDSSTMSDISLSDILRSKVTPLLKLTRKGQFFFAAFHDDALAHGLHGLPILGSKSPGGMPHGAIADEYDYRLFVNLCEYWSKREGLHIDYGKTDQLMRQYHCRDDMPMFFSASNRLKSSHANASPEPSPYDRPPKTRPAYPASSVSHPHYTKNNASRSVSSPQKNTPLLTTQAPPRTIKKHHHAAIADNPMFNETFAALAEVIKDRNEKKDKQATIFNSMETS